MILTWTDESLPGWDPAYRATHGEITFWVEEDDFHSWEFGAESTDGTTWRGPGAGSESKAKQACQNAAALGDMDRSGWEKEILVPNAPPVDAVRPNVPPSADVVRALLDHGFAEVATGGGCRCLARAIAGVVEVRITDADDTASLPTDPDRLYVGIYHDDPDENPAAGDMHYGTLESVTAWVRLFESL